ncbi:MULTISPECIES: hypothetical protein [unclassified Caballeronia]|uniref:tetratricopeptide repeat protein n=1 Tax=unclassified Caballeronia TaxID=2646786 RepID=UPI002027818D|nr:MULTISPECIES: hypothetical protein [unclassified Caballeronia]
MTENRTWADERIAQALRYGLAEQHELALECFLDVLLRYPTYPKIEKNCGLAWEKLGYTKEALLLYRQALMNDPGDPDLPNWIEQGRFNLFKRALRAYACEPLIVTERLCVELLEVDSNDVAALALLSQIYLKKNEASSATSHQDMVRAACAQKRLLRSNTGDADSYEARTCVELARALREADELAASETAYRLALTISPDFFDAIIELGSLLLKSGPLAEAQSLREKTAKLVPSGENYYLLAQSLELSGNFEQALSAFAESTSRRPEAAQFHVGYGYNLVRLGLWAQGWPELGWMFSDRGFVEYGCPWALHTPCPMEICSDLVYGGVEVGD